MGKTIHTNILDTILNTSNHASYTGSPTLGDALMDASTRGIARGSSRTAAQNTAVMGRDNELSEAFSKVAAQEETRVSHRFRSVAAAVKFAGRLIPLPGVKLSSESLTQLQAARAAGRRLERLMGKTAEQMQQDGATKLADYFDPLLVPGWAVQARADMSLLQSIKDTYTDARQAQPKTASSPAANEEIKTTIRAWLNEGVRPRVIEERLAKLADLQGFSKSIASEYLQDHAGVLGLAYMEPNHYMNDCPSTFKRFEVKVGGVRARSVKQIAACKGCQYFKQASGSKTCGLYGLPVVAGEIELMPIINNLVKGAKQKKATLVAIANGDDQRAATPKQSSATAHTGAKGTVLRMQPKQAAAATFTASEALALHNAGKGIREIYAHGSKIAGAAQARTAVQQFVRGLKGSKTRIALSQIDCRSLPGKLGSSNQIYGDSRCAGCTYRNGMHCGLTGGTLVTFPGLDKVKTGAKVAEGAPKDGHGLLKEFDLTSAKPQPDIRLSTPVRDNVVVDAISKMDL